MNKLLAAVVIALLAGCTDAPNATRVLLANGYTNIQAGGYGWMACSSDDTYHTNFTATAPNGTQVTGTVCQGLFMRGAVIRLD